MTVPYYVLRAITRRETTAVKSLTEMRIACYLPMERLDRRFGGEDGYIDRPLFPGYLFAEIPDDDYHAAINAFAVLGPVYGHNALGERIPRQIDPDLVQVIREAQEAGAFDRRRTVKPLVIGDTVRVTSGPFADRISAIIELRGQDRLTLLFGGLMTEMSTSEVEVAA